MEKRSVGLTLFGIFTILSGVNSMLTGVLTGVVAELTFMSYIGIAVGIVFVIMGVAILKLKKWAWFLSMFFAMSSLVVGIGGLMVSPNKSLMVVGSLIPGLIIYYLTRPKVKNQFR
ncbi:hypothetical protein ACFL2G_02485 [Candidatus Omnitrophota bacterium]